MMPMFANAGIAGGGIGGIGRLCPEPNVAELLAAGISVGSPAWLLAVSQAFPVRCAHHLSCRIQSAHTCSFMGGAAGCASTPCCVCPIYIYIYIYNMVLGLVQISMMQEQLHNTCAYILYICLGTNKKIYINTCVYT